MKSKIFVIFIVISIILVIPQAYGQSSSLEEVDQKSVQVTIDLEGNVNVAHQIKDSTDPKQLNFVDGVISNLKFIDEVGIQKPIDIDKDTDHIVISPDQEISFVTYDLEDALVMKDNVWTLDFRYLQTTIFTIPEEVDLIFVNQRPVFLDEKNKFACHGCQMLLEYSTNEPKNIQKINWEDKEFFVEIRTHAEIENFDFSQPGKKISFNVNSNNHYITTIIPLELLWKPYLVLLDDEKIFFHEYITNGTHVWVIMKPDTSGEIAIIGTTVVPEFPIIAPLAIGFLIILVVPLIRKFNLH